MILLAIKNFINQRDKIFKKISNKIHIKLSLRTL